MKRIPLLAHDGLIRAYALVDDVDYDRLSVWTWRLNSAGYAVRSETVGGRKRTLRMHRDLLGLTYGDGLEGDHRNRNTLDNRRENLRITTHGQNHQNKSAEGQRTSAGALTSSRFRGVTWNKGCGKWQAQAGLDGKRHYLGVFESEEDAARAAAAFRAVHMPWSTAEAAA